MAGEPAIEPPPGLPRSLALAGSATLGRSALLPELRVSAALSPPAPYADGEHLLRAGRCRARV